MGKRVAKAVPEPPSDRELRHDFVVEALEHLGNIEIDLINLEQNPEDRDCIDSIFRPFHSIKGVSGFLSLKQINQFAHEVETLLDNTRSGQLRITPEFVDLVLSAVDQMKAMIHDLKSSLETGSPLTRWDLASHLNQIRTLEKRLRSDRSQGPEPIGQILVGNATVRPDDVKMALEKQENHSERKRLGEILIGEEKAKPRQVLHALREQRAQISALEGLRGKHEAVKVDTEKLDTLVSMLRELVVVHSMIRKNPHVTAIRDQKLSRDFSRLGRITSELQKAVMSLRMVPVRVIFEKMVRLVRDLSRKSGKRVELRMEGEDTEIDRNMADALYDPLVHMIRNAVDHGIESPEDRKKTGKSESGCITLRGYRRGGNIGIEIRDDGRGLDRDRILRLAREKGLIKAGDRLAESQIGRLIFRPGLSTSEKVTEVSGRGVGMDVVKKAVERLHGKVEIESEPGKGSVFTVRLPLTLAIIDD